MRDARDAAVEDVEEQRAENRERGGEVKALERLRNREHPAEETGSRQQVRENVDASIGGRFFAVAREGADA